MSEAAHRRRLLSIGEVLARLQGEFADLSHSKVRFLEASGLIEPRRTASGYRKFTEGDVERIRVILTLQRDHYMPLKAIGEFLDAQDRGLTPAPVAGGIPVAAPPASSAQQDPFATTRPPAKLRPAELAASAEIDAKTLASLETFGLISPSSSGFFDSDDVEVATLAGQLSRFGIEARHLRMFRNAADREINLVEQVTTPMRHHRGTDSPARADEVAREIAGICLQLHTALVRSALSQLS